MTTYRILPHPGVSAVFFDASESLSLAELTLCLRRLDTPCGAPRARTAQGVRWYLFDAEERLPERDTRRLKRLSSLYALFEEQGDLLRPVQTPRDALFGEDLSAILKYTGKTNALFTRLMLHIAELSLPAAPEGRLRMLDPMAGKGTALYEALMRGWDAAGIEIVRRAAHDAAVYFQKYLETEKWKHTLRKEKAYGAPVWRFAFGRDKEALKRDPGRLTMVAGDAGRADRYFGKEAFDMVAGDLPYGVAHGSVAGGSLSRGPAPLLDSCLPALHGALKAGGVLALSWNTLAYPAENMLQMLGKHGFACLREPPYDALRHRVDASIQRDIAVGVKGRGKASVK
ncbi:MAG: hypothetical protein FWF69_00435 [Firmicutes bacterium]|nr:hypothetical protein [Bacillota bacterium]